MSRRIIDLLQAVALLSGIGLIWAGGLLVHEQKAGGAWYVLAGCLVLLSSQIGVASNIAELPLLRRPPLLLELPALAAAAAITAWSCFSFINSFEGFHFDVAEFAASVNARLVVLSPSAPLRQMFLETPQEMITAMFVQKLGFSLLSLRLLGALFCFATLPALYFASRIIFNRGMAALGALAFAGSLWNFTLSKVATWDADVPCLAALSVGLAIGVFQLRWGWLLLPGLLLSLQWGLNVYEAFRLAFPVCLTVAILGALLRKGRRWRALGIVITMAASIAIQATCIDPLFWERITGSALLKPLTLHSLKIYADVMFGGMFHSSWDIYLSQSQNGLDHPLIMGMIIAGLCLILTSFWKFEHLALLAWTLGPVTAGLLFEGQWRRTTVAMPALYLLAAVPLAALAVYLSRCWREESRKRRWYLFALPIILALIMTSLNITRFPEIQRGRWGGYYRTEQHFIPARTAAQVCQSGVPVYAFTSEGQAAVFWSFINQYEGGKIDCYLPNENVFDPSGPQIAKFQEVTAAAMANSDRETAVFIRNEEVTAPLIDELRGRAQRSAALVRSAEIPGGETDYLLFYLGGQGPTPSADAEDNSLTELSAHEPQVEESAAQSLSVSNGTIPQETR